MDRVELHLSGMPLTEQMMDCWNSFYARVVLTFHGAPAAFSQPYGQLWAPLPRLSHEPIVMGVSQHIVFVPGGTPLLFCYEFRAIGSAERWHDWLPNAVQVSALLIRPAAFRLQRVHDAIRIEMPVCPINTLFFALVPALTPANFPLVIVVKISFPPMVKVGAIFCPDRLSRLGLLRHLGLDSMCLLEDEEPCTCYHNGIQMSEHPVLFSSADFVSCYKGRSYIMVADDVVSVFDAESIMTRPIINDQDADLAMPLVDCQLHSGAVGQHSCCHGNF